MNESVPAGNPRAVLLLIGGIPVTMILLATWLWYFVAKGDLDLVGMLGTANRGELVQPPRQLDDVALLDDAGLPVAYADLEPRWSLLVPAAGPECAADCEQRLYLTRQIHIAMGKEFKRIRRLYVSDTAVADTTLAVPELSDQTPAPAEFDDYLGREHRGMKSMVLPGDAYPALFAEQLNEPSTWYLVDPAGWIMMAYDSSVPYKDVISDLKFLLKNSGG